MKGMEWLIEAFGCDSVLLLDRRQLDLLFETIVRRMDLRPVGQPVWHKRLNIKLQAARAKRYEFELLLRRAWRQQGSIGRLAAQELVSSCVAGLVLHLKECVTRAGLQLARRKFFDLFRVNYRWIVPHVLYIRERFIAPN